ncbi:MAG TPA: penicillin-binding transpeptidase domain-containing protein [Pyrinomonadaceae bacterium]|nr:penicillin-binding transpeptidase domain-containing protein [Pyrinomonadaceae bacterium]
MLFLLFLQTAATETAASVPVPEKQPALLSLIYMGGLALMGLLLLLSLLRNRRRRSALAAVAPEDLPEEVRQRLGTTSTNRGLRALRWLFVLLALSVFGFHIYWARYAEESNARFQELNYKDLRNRRLSESTLRGWILDRSADLDKALALYRRDAKGNITREYPMDRALAHLFGSDRGDPGLERALFGLQSNAVPEALQVVKGENHTQQANMDVRLTIDRDLQQAVVEELHKSNRKGAVVVLNPQTGEVLALYSNPSYSLKEVQDEATWIRLEADKRDRPLVSRALSKYYVPGSTFKTTMMIMAYASGIPDAQFTCTSGGYIARPGAKPIWDDAGPSEVHGTIGMDVAFQKSCNQYFAQLAVELGPERIEETAKLLGLGTYDTPNEAVRGFLKPDIWNASTAAIQRAIAPRESTMVTGPLGDKFNRYDLALEGYGQGYAGQMTPLQMALFAAVVANMEGKLMKPKIEMDRPPEAYSQVVTPEKAAEMRQIMGLVTLPGGTAAGAMAPVNAAGIRSGGKTGTAQKEVPLYDPKTGELVMRKKVERDPKGNIIREYEQVVMDNCLEIDAWYISIAPLDHPKIAIAVVVEGRRCETSVYGGRYAAPIAAALILKAKQLGLLDDAATTQPAPKKNRKATPLQQTARR